MKTSIPAYRWSDGTVATLLVREVGMGSVLQVTAGAVVVELSFSCITGHPCLVLEVPPAPDFVHHVEKWDRRSTFVGSDLASKLTGLALDLGVDRFSPAWTGLLLTYGGEGTPSVLPYPRYIPDEEWEARYETARGLSCDYGEQRPSDWAGKLGPISDLFIRIDRPAVLFLAVWGGGGSRLSGKSLEAVVDGVLDREFVLPESGRSAWEAAHVERGEFLLPTREEVELYRVTGELLPFFWGPRQLLDWLSERRSS